MDNKTRIQNGEHTGYLATEPLFGPYSVWLAELCEIKKGMHVLDVGCGIGVSTFPLLDMIGPKGKIVGVDIAPQLISQSRQRLKSTRVRNASFVVCDAQKLGFADGLFDCVVSNFAIIQVNDKAQALSEMDRVLKPGGRLGLTIPGIDHFKEFYKIAAEVYQNEWFQKRQDRLKSDPDTYQALFKNLRTQDMQMYSRIETFTISTLDKYDIILQTRGPQNSVLSRVPDNQKAQVWQRILNELKGKLARDGYLHLTIDAHALVARKPLADIS